MSAPRKNSRRAALLVVLLALLAVAGVWGGRAFRAHRVASTVLPARPNLSGRPAGLREKIADAEHVARTFSRPDLGLAALSRLYHANGFYDEALQCYAGLQQLAPGEARWPHLQAAILAEFGRLDEALPREERASVLAPAYLPARLRLGEILLKADRTAAAAKAYADVLAYDATNPYALLGLAKCDLATGDWTRADEHLRAAVRGNPDFVGALSLLVTVTEHSGDQAGAAALRTTIGKREFVDFPDPWLDDLLDDCYDPYRLSVAAALAKSAGDAATARRRMERAAALAPEEASFRRQLGKMLSQQRDYAAAQPHVEKAVALEPGDSDAWILLVELLTARGDFDGAQRALSAGLANCPKSAALHYTYGQKLSRIPGNESAAIAEFKTAKALRPSEANAYIDLALVYFRQERIEQGVAELQAALTVQPDHPLALGVLARHAINTRDEATARHWISRLRAQPRVPAEDLKIITAEYQQQFGRAP